MTAYGLTHRFPFAAYIRSHSCSVMTRAFFPTTSTAVVIMHFYRRRKAAFDASREGTPRALQPATMALAHETETTNRDPRAVKVVAKSIYKELVDGGFSESDLMALAGELLSLVATGVASKREDDAS